VDDQKVSDIDLRPTRKCDRKLQTYSYTTTWITKFWRESKFWNLFHHEHGQWLKLIENVYTRMKTEIIAYGDINVLYVNSNRDILAYVLIWLWNVHKIIKARPHYSCSCYSLYTLRVNIRIITRRSLASNWSSVDEYLRAQVKARRVSRRAQAWRAPARAWVMWTHFKSVYEQWYAMRSMMLCIICRIQKLLWLQSVT
jgi:hypothetical protein